MLLTTLILIIGFLLYLNERGIEKESLPREKIRLDKMAYLELRKKSGFSRIN